ncbi:hypothetical protein M422DRAFT_35571 [Sphaerobolus stellatus SS14]|uniref:Unplaced genomic scaffold SPHSTscaffold_141, whole genome shotgun sequence n=1 Tax=Sphaerobolus stellatus (strain SS14) TaxID=990650 RepID=A0A0C9UEH0_SPHS4|nr:hypothetical protein M422DRAFT_35571 [Sphaerobolus stellatus SS14]
MHAAVSSVEDVQAKMGTKGIPTMKKKSVAAIHLLPPEILSKIFIHCLPFFSVEEFELKRWYTHEGNHASHITIGKLLRVCHQWCHIVFDTPMLFVQIIIREGMSQVAFNYALAALKHSGDLSLDIFMQHPDISQYPSSRLMDLFTQISRNIYRIRVLMVDGSRNMVILFPRGSRILAPRLQYLELHSSNEDLDGNTASWLVGSLVANNLVGYRTHSSQSIHWQPVVFIAGGLRKFIDTCTRFTYDELATILTGFPLLEELRVNFEEVPMARQKISDTMLLSLSQLQEFQLGWSGGDKTLVQLFSQLRLPKLKSLAFYSLGWDMETITPDIISAISNHLTASLAPIESFLWVGVLLQPTQLNKLLQALPDVQELSLKYCELEADATHVLDRTTYPDLCPRLEKINFTGSILPKAELLNVIHSRIQSSKEPGYSQLRHAWVFDCGFGREEMMQLAEWSTEYPGFDAILGCLTGNGDDGNED